MKTITTWVTMDVIGIVPHAVALQNQFTCRLFWLQSAFALVITMPAGHSGLFLWEEYRLGSKRVVVVYCAHGVSDFQY